MNFFKTLSEMGITDVIIQFSKSENDVITIFVAPKTIARENPLKSLKPIFMTGTAEEIGNSFFKDLEKNMFDVPPAKPELSKAQQIKAMSDAMPPEEKFEHVDNSVEAMNARAAERELREQELEAEQLYGNGTESIDETVENISEVAPVIEETVEEVRIQRTEKLKTEKVIKINNEKVLKEFMTSIKDQNILGHKDKIEELFSTLSEEEMNKPFYKKVRIDLDIAIRKEANLAAAREKHGFAPKPVEQVETEKSYPITEEVQKDLKSDVPLEIQEIAAASPNVIIASIAGAEKEPDTIKEDLVLEAIVVEQEMCLDEIEEEVPLVFEAPKREIKLLSTGFTLEQYLSVGWTEESLVEAGRAEYIIPDVPLPPAPPVPIPVPPIPAQKLSYTFPTPFDEMTEEEQMQEEAYRNSANSTGPQTFEENV